MGDAALVPGAPRGLRRLDAAAVRAWVAAGLDALSAGRAEIDSLNVFPLPDGDTGSNLLRTWQAVADDLAHVPQADTDTVLAVVRRGAVAGARGNSGAILSAWLDGLAGALIGSAGDGPALVTALAAAARSAPAAVGDPANGTILTVASAAAEPVPDAEELNAVATVAAAAARAALAATTDQLPALAEAGVVDAGGRGLVVLLEALEAVVCGRPQLHVPAPGGAAGPRRALLAAREAGSADYGYEVQFLLTADPGAVGVLRARLTALGDSLVVVGAERHWNVHLHCNDVGAVLECGLEAGRPYRVTVTRFADQRPPAAAVRRPGRAAVVVCEGAGLRALYEAEGAVVVGASRPSVADLLAAIEATDAGEVVLLPCDGELLAAAQQAAAAARHDGARAVVVVPTSSPVQGLAALAVSQPDRAFGDDVVAMADASGRARPGAVAVAVAEALTMAGRCYPGDVLGIIDRDVVSLGADVAEVACDLLDRMLAGGGELVTVVTGDGLDPAVAAAVLAHLRSAHPFVEPTVYPGGQPTALLVGVE